MFPGARRSTFNRSPLWMGLAVLLTAVNPVFAKRDFGTNFWFNGAIADNWPNTAVFKDEIYNTGGAAFATTTDPWNPDFLAEIAPYNLYRFMDWSKTNNSPVTDWSQRQSKTAAEQSTKNGNAGIAWEWMVHLANKQDADMWVNIPHLLVTRNGIEHGTNDYVRKLAILIKHGVDMGTTDLDTLGGGLSTRSQSYFLNNGGTLTGDPLEAGRKLYVEYSNETWNFSNHVAHVSAEGLALGLHSNQYTAGFMFHAWAAARVFKDFEDIYGSNSPQIVKVTGVQTSGSFQIKKQLEVYRSTTWNPLQIYPDAFTGTFYIGNQVNGASPTVFQDLRDDLYDTRVPRWSAMKDEIDLASAADGRNYQFIAYEGGQHITTNAEAPNDDPRMYDLYMELLDEADKYFDYMVHYTHDGKPGSGGAWGAVKATTGAGFPNSQPTLQDTIDDNPKYRAILDYIGSGSPSAPAAFSAATGAADGSLNLSWNDVSNETGYRLERRPSGGSYTVVNGSIAANITSFADSGLVAGAAYDYRLRAENSNGSSSYVTASGAAGPPPDTTPAITTSTLPDVRVGQAYGPTITATGGNPPLTWSATGLPAFLTLDPATGTIAGTPSVSGSFPIRVTVNDTDDDSSFADLTLVIDPPVSASGWFETNGTLTMEAEDAEATLNGDSFIWAEKSGGGVTYMDADNGSSGFTLGAWSTATELLFRVNISTPGEYALAVRRLAPDGAANSLFAGLDDNQIGDDQFTFTATSFTWTAALSLGTLSVGEHTIHLRRREPDYQIDRIFLARTSASFPTGTAVGPTADTLQVTTGEEPTGFERWQRIHFTPAQLEDSAMSSALSTPLQDGIPNKVKFALGHGPWEQVVPIKPEAPQPAGQPAFTYTRNLDPEAPTPIVFVSSGLAGWSSDPLDYKATIISSDSNIETIRVTPPDDYTEGQWFLRILVP